MKNSGLRSPHRAQRGQAAAEFIIIGMLFFAMLGGVFEMTYVFRAKHLLNTATFDAARTGSMHNALMAPMEATLARDMAPLYMQGGTTVADVNAAIGRATTTLTSMKVVGKPIVIVSPTQEVFTKFSEPEKVRLSNQTSETIQPVIPNDNLEWRARDVQPVVANGLAATMNVQDANLLKIRVYWCQHLVVPALDLMIHQIATMTSTSPQQAMCDSLGTTIDNIYIAIESDAVVRMQSPVAFVDNNLN
jgi:hypothetical protein